MGRWGWVYERTIVYFQTWIRSQMSRRKKTSVADIYVCVCMRGCLGDVWSGGSVTTGMKPVPAIAVTDCSQFRH